MKKEIMNLFNLGEDDKTLKINELFELRANYIDKNGINVAVSGNKVADVKIKLYYTGHCAKMNGASREVSNTGYDTAIKDIKSGMESILDEIKDSLVKNFENGYLG